MNDVVLDILVKLAPIFILIGTGAAVRASGMLKPDTINDLKKIIINVSLPAILFTAFLKMELKFSYLIIIVLIFSVCILLFLTGIAGKKIFRFPGEYIPYFTTGFEFGMMGAVFFGAAFGLENIGYIAVIALGHEFFIWFVYVTMLNKKLTVKTGLMQTMKSFMSSPVIIAITAGLILNVILPEESLQNIPGTGAVTRSLDYLAGLTVPLILIIVGYNLRINTKILIKGLPVIMFRLFSVTACALFIDKVVFGLFMKPDIMFTAALYTFFILPPPFILPLFIKKENTEELAFINGITVVYSVISIAVFSLYFAYFQINNM
ncbi:MAG: hypothetical protein JW982_01420 [Spirochaetes bacterium]|nr:hypothetical protein [Spirochaetota bacterium]